MKKGKLITIGGAIVVLALCGYFFMGTSSKGKISFQTEKVTRNSMTDVVVATGTVEPVTKVDVGTQVSGIIDRIYVDYNSVVKKGQLITWNDVQFDETNEGVKIRREMEEIFRKEKRL